MNARFHLSQASTTDSDRRHAMPSAELKITDLSVDLGRRRVLHDVNMAISSSSGVTVLVGSNGSGKSTLLRSVMGILKRNRAGQIHVAGYAVPGEVRQARRHLGYLPQHSSFPGRSKVQQALDYAAWLQMMTPTKTRERVESLLDDLDLNHVRDRRIETLSGGTLQRVLLAQAVIHEPMFVLLDEPTVGLDLTQQASFRKVISTLAKHSSIVISTHHIEDVDQLADRVVVLFEGRIVWEGNTTELEHLSDDKHLVDRRSRLESSLADLMISGRGENR